MKVNAISRIKAKTTKIVVNLKEIDSLFVRLDNARDIRQAQVNRLFKVLEQGEHFETPLVTHYSKGKHRLLDGNHRHEAIKKYLIKYEERKVELWIFYYENLSEQDEREYYSKWNSGMKQTTNDFVKQYWSVIPITTMFKKNGFPFEVSHSWTSKAIEFKTLVGAYLTKKDKIFAGGFNGSALDFIEEAKHLGKDDYAIIKEFTKEYIAIYGNPDKRNSHYKQAVFYSIMRIWLDNLNIVPYPKLQNAMQKLKNHERVIYYEKLGGTRENCIYCRRDLLEVINGRFSTNKVFV